MLGQAPSYQRFAIYYAPPAGSPLAALGAAWLGYDADTGAAVDPRDLIGEAVLGSLPMSHEALVRPARVYGFHATLKAPFRLGEGIDSETLDGAVAALAARTPPVTAPRLRVKSDLGFVALQPDGKAAALDALAASCVTGLDLLRAPLTAAELAKRRRNGLDTVEDAHLRNWGYPYVLDRFRFHVTLTSQLARLEARELAAVLDDLFSPALEQPFRVDELCLFGDPGEGRPFRLLKRYALTGQPAV